MFLFSLLFLSTKQFRTCRLYVRNSIVSQRTFQRVWECVALGSRNRCGEGVSWSLQVRQPKSQLGRRVACRSLHTVAHQLAPWLMMAPRLSAIPGPRFLSQMPVLASPTERHSFVSRYTLNSALPRICKSNRCSAKLRFIFIFSSTIPKMGL